MTPDIERLAKEAGLRKSGQFTRNGVNIGLHIVSSEDLAKFAALIAEECAKECDKFIEDVQPAADNPIAERIYSPLVDGAKACRQMIRAKFALSSDKPEAK